MITDNMDSLLLVLEGDLKKMAEAVTDLNTRKETLEAMAEPIVEEAKRRASPGGGVFEEPTGNLAASIVAQWSIKDPNRIAIGWSAKGYYGPMFEKGFLHYKSGPFIKRPHLRPALNKMRKRSEEAGIKVLRKHLMKAAP
jgi:hypothetical protein